MQLPLKEEDFDELILSVGIHRKRRSLRPIEVARRMKTVLDGGVLQGAETISFTVNSLARRLGFRDSSMLPRFLSLLKIPTEFQEMVEWGARRGAMSHLTFSIASAISTLPLEQQRDLILEVFKRELNKQETISVIQLLRRNPSISLQDSVSEVLRMRPQKIYHEILIGSFPPGSSMANSSLPTGRKEAVLNSVLKPIFQGERATGRISENHFLISTSENGKRLFDEHCKGLGTRPSELVAKLCEERLLS